MVKTIHKDKITASDRYSMSEIAEMLDIKKELMQKITEKTVYAIKAKAIELGFENFFSEDKIGKRTNFIETKKFIQYYNVYNNGIITDSDINKFYSIEKLKDIAHLIQFAVRRKENLDYYSFSIKQIHFDKYLETGKAYTPRSGRIAVAGENSKKQTMTSIWFEPSGRIQLPINETYKQFKAGIEFVNSVSNTKTTIPEQTEKALIMYMLANPQVWENGISKTLDESKIKRRGKSITNKQCRVLIKENIHNKVIEALQRYNILNGTRKTVIQFYNEAAQGMIDRLPLQYTEPKKYQEMIDIEYYNKSLKEKLKNS